MQKKNLATTAVSIIFIFIHVSISAQEKVKSVIEKTGWSPFIEIRIRHCVESYRREEINVLYVKDGVVKIHSMRLSTYEREKQIDTVFTLNADQLHKLDKFDQYFASEQFPTGIIMAGTVTTMGFIVNDQVRTLRNKSDYSFIEDLLTK